MEEFEFRTPVLFLIFNRPDTTQQVFNEIRKAKPKDLFVAADGPREGNPLDKHLCQEARTIINQVDWDCNVHTLFREKNLGCKLAVSSAIDWFFSEVKEGIILEDDCVPDQSFFRFCQELLEYYRDDERIMMISGDNFQFGKKRTEYSYYFSRYTHIWGWATWKRAWKYYDREMKLWPEIKKGRWLFDLLSDKAAVKYWEKIFDETFHGRINTWDYQWLFSCWIQNGLTILPNVNLISNIGFDQNATHTIEMCNLSKVPTFPIKFPLAHPRFVIRDNIADSDSQNVIFDKNSKFNHIQNIILNYLKHPRKFPNLKVQ